MMRSHPITVNVYDESGDQVCAGVDLCPLCDDGEYEIASAKLSLFPLCLIGGDGAPQLLVVKTERP